MLPRRQRYFKYTWWGCWIIKYCWPVSHHEVNDDVVYYALPAWLFWAWYKYRWVEAGLIIRNGDDNQWWLKCYSNIYWYLKWCLFHYRFEAAKWHKFKIWFSWWQHCILVMLMQEPFDDRRTSRLLKCRRHHKMPIVFILDVIFDEIMVVFMSLWRILFRTMSSSRHFKIEMSAPSLK